MTKKIKVLMSSEIKYIYFDLGGVVIFDFSGNNKWQEMIQGLGLNESEQKVFNEIFNNYAKKYNFCIDYDLDNLIPILKKRGLRFPKDYSLLTDMVNRFDANPTLWPILTSLQTKYYLGLVTNMFPRMLYKIKKRNIVPPVPWKNIIDSTKVGKQKPHRDFYNTAQKAAGVSGNEILLIDNLPINLKGAEALGWHTLLYDPTRINESNKIIMKYAYF